MIGANSQSRMPKPAPCPKFLATSMLTMIQMMMLTTGMKIEDQPPARAPGDFDDEVDVVDGDDRPPARFTGCGQGHPETGDDQDEPGYLEDEPYPAEVGGRA